MSTQQQNIAIATAVPVTENPQVVTQAPGQPQVIYVQAPQDPRLACRGIQPGGMYTRENYCGPISLVIGLLIFPCICCCPCDEREVYIEPGTGRRVVLSAI